MEFGVGRGGLAGCGGAAGLGDNGVEGLVELVRIDDLDPLGLGCDKDRRGMAEANAEAEFVVLVDLFGELAVGIDHEGHDAAVCLKELLGKGLEVFLAGDGRLAGEDGAAKVFGGARRNLVLDVARSDGRVEAPDVSAEGEVVADEGDFVLLDGGVNDREGAGAGGTLEIFKLIDGDLRAGWRLDGRGVLEGVALAGGNGDLSGGGEREEKDGSGYEGGVHRCQTHRVIVRILAEGR